MRQPTLRRLFTLILALLLACTACSAAFAAAYNDFQIDGKTLVKYYGRDIEVTVPDGIEKLGAYAFEGSLVRKVNLPESLKEIEDHCFFSCRSLMDITLPASVRKISEAQVFGYNPALKEIKVAEGSRYFKTVDGVLFSADGLVLLYYPDGKSGAYEIPEGTRKLGYTSFGEPEMPSISIPSTLSNIVDPHFAYIKGLKEIIVSEKSSNYHTVNGALYDRSHKLVAYPNSKREEELKPEDFDSKITQVEPWAFMNNKYLKRIEFPKGLRRVSWMSFDNAKSLQEVILPASVSYVGQYAFSDCIQLKRVTVLNRNAKFEACRRDEDPRKENIFTDSSIYAALCGYAGGTLEAYAEKCGLKFGFLDPETGKVIEISPDFEIQGRTLVKYNGAGGEVTVPKIIEKLGEWAFEGSHVTKVNLPESLKEIGSYCFMDCKELTDITLPASLQKLGEAQVFAFNSSLKEIKVAEGNKKFKAVDGVLFSANGQELLYYPDGKTGSYVIPEGTRKLGYTAFGKPDMPSITIPASLGKVSGGDFSGILLKSFRVSEKCRNYHTVDGVLYDRSHNLIAYPGAKGKTELKPEDFEQGITQITNWAFQDNKHLKKVEFPEGLKKIGWMSFTWSESLEEVIIPASVTSIDQYIFSFSHNLKKVTVLNKNAKFAADRRDQDPLEHHIFRYCENAVLCGWAGSTAEKYAETHGLKFEALEEEKK